MTFVFHFILDSAYCSSTIPIFSAIYYITFPLFNLFYVDPRVVYLERKDVFCRNRCCDNKLDSRVVNHKAR